MNEVSRKSALVFFLCGLVAAGATITQAESLPEARRRCAIDIGSGETKLSAAEVVYRESSTGIAKLLSKTVLIPFARNLKNGVIPDIVIREAITKINGLRSECDALGAREYAGVATSGFRMARNGQQALEKISRETKTPLRIITGEQEAVLAFLAAASALPVGNRNLVVWDIGGGSLQFCMSANGSNTVHREYVISSGHQGVELFRRQIAKRLNRGSAQSVNPLGQQEMTRAIELAKQSSYAINPKIIERLRRGDMRVAGVGSIHAESLSNQAGLQFNASYKFYTLDRVRAAAKRAAVMSDQDFRNAYPENNYPGSQATNVALVLGYMEGLQIREVVPLEVNLTDGLLVDETYWPRATR